MIGVVFFGLRHFSQRFLKFLLFSNLRCEFSNFCFNSSVELLIRLLLPVKFNVLLFNSCLKHFLFAEHSFLLVSQRVNFSLLFFVIFYHFIKIFLDSLQLFVKTIDFLFFGIFLAFHLCPEIFCLFAFSLETVNLLFKFNFLLWEFGSSLKCILLLLLKGFLERLCFKVLYFLLSQLINEFLFFFFLLFD